MDKHYRNLLISAAAVPLPKGKGWRARGVILSPHDKPIIELKRIETRNIIFGKKEDAEVCAFHLCKDWINEKFGFRVN